MILMLSFFSYQFPVDIPDLKKKKYQMYCQNAYMHLNQLLQVYNETLLCRQLDREIMIGFKD